MLMTSAIPETWSECNACFIPLGCYFHQIVLVQTVLKHSTTERKSDFSQELGFYCIISGDMHLTCEKISCHFICNSISIGAAGCLFK